MDNQSKLRFRVRASPLTTDRLNSLRKEKGFKNWDDYFQFLMECQKGSISQGVHHPNDAVQPTNDPTLQTILAQMECLNDEIRTVTSQNEQVISLLKSILEILNMGYPEAPTTSDLATRIRQKLKQYEA